MESLMTAEELLEHHKGLIIYHVNREWDESPLSKDDVLSICYETFMECYVRWDRERNFGRYFGTLLTYNIKAARMVSPFSVSAKTLWRGVEVPSCVSGEAPLQQDNADGGIVFDTVADDREPPCLDKGKVREAVSNLPDGVRDVMQLVLLGYELSEIGSGGRGNVREGILPISRQAVHQRYNKGIELLKEELWQHQH